MRKGLMLSQVHKIAHNIRVQGDSFTFARPKLNEFGEPTAGFTNIVIRGLYHTSESYGSTLLIGADGSTTRQERLPGILAMLEDGLKIQSDDILEYRGRKYKVIESQDVGEAGICVDISLDEVQDDGK